jgi:hypothetical protein
MLLHVSESETRSARSRQYTDSDPDEQEQACDKHRVQNGILPFAGKGDYLFHGFDYYGSTTIGHKKGTSFPPVPAPNISHYAMPPVSATVAVSAF